MKQNKITTAEEFLSNNIDRTIFTFIDDDLEDNTQLAQTLKECLIKFTNLHVKAALEAASEKATVDVEEVMGHKTGYVEVNKESILNAYPENLIQ